MVAECDNGHSGNGTPPKARPPASNEPPPSAEAGAIPPGPPVSPEPAGPPEPANPPLTGQSFANPGQVVEPYDTSESTPPPGAAAEPAAPPVTVSPQQPIEEETAAPAEQQLPELNFFDNAMISFSLAPDWAKFLAAAVVTVVLALIAIGLINGDSSSDDAPDGFVPQTPELEDGALPDSPESDVSR